MVQRRSNCKRKNIFLFDKIMHIIERLILPTCCRKQKHLVHKPSTYPGKKKTLKESGSASVIGPGFAPTQGPSRDRHPAQHITGIPLFNFFAFCPRSLATAWCHNLTLTRTYESHMISHRRVTYAHISHRANEMRNLGR